MGLTDLKDPKEVQDINNFYESVGFLLGGLKHYYNNLEKTALFDNLRISTNLKSATSVRNRLLPVVEDTILKNTTMDDEVTKKHLLNLTTLDFNITGKQAKEEGYFSKIWLNMDKGMQHLYYHKFKN